jgi:pantetheine-phosphate adenylyltransferase
MIILLWALSFSQEDGLGRLFAQSDHEFSIRPPAEWIARSMEPPAVVRFAPVETPPTAQMILIHYFCKNGATLAQFRKEMDEYMKAAYPGGTSLLDRLGTVAGRPSFHVAVKSKDKSGQEVVVYRIVVHRSNLEYFIIDAQCLAGAWEKMQGLFEKSAGSFQIVPFDGLLIHFAREVGASVIIRGLRAVSDFEYETQMANMNARMEPDIETIFLMASDRHQFIASSLVKDIARLGGDTSQFVSKKVFERLKAKFKKA